MPLLVHVATLLGGGTATHVRTVTPGRPQAAAGGVIKAVKYEMPVYPGQGF